MGQEHEHTYTKVTEYYQCTHCGQILQPVTVQLHPEQKETLDWLIQDKGQTANQIIDRLIWLEGNKRRKIASERKKKP